MNIYITLDYELFLGNKTGTPENCLVKPMSELCRIASETGVKYTIFVDATYLLRLNELKDTHTILKKHYDIVLRNIEQCVKAGHDIQLHIHPQWKYSDWDSDSCSWKMDFGHYKLSDLELHEGIELIERSKALLDSIIGYSTTAYRAGGFCIENFSDYKDTFQKLGLKADSSVVREQYVKSPIHNFDYRNIPSAQIYNFSDSVKIEDKRGAFIELSISSFVCSPVKFITKIRNLRNGYKPSIVYKDGESISDGTSLLWYRIKTLFSKYNTFCSIDSTYSCFLEVFYDNIRKKNYNELVLIGHPKNATDASLSNLRTFLLNHSEDNFRTIKDIIII